MPKSASLTIVCMVMICSLNSLAADGKATSFADLPPEVQASIKAAMQRNIATEDFTLTASDGANGDEFGLSLAIDGNTVVVGALEAGQGLGAAYVFVKPANGWANMTQTAELTASDGRQAGCFGCSVAISGNTVVVGDVGLSTAYVFVEPKSGWSNMTQTAELQSGASSSCMGWSTSIDAKVVAAGSQCNTGFKGAAFVFVEPAQGWRNTSTPTLRLSIPFSHGQDYFGTSVAVSGTSGVVGAPYAPAGPPPQFEPGPGEAFLSTAK